VSGCCSVVLFFVYCLAYMVCSMPECMRRISFAAMPSGGQSMLKVPLCCRKGMDAAQVLIYVNRFFVGHIMFETFCVVTERLVIRVKDLEGDVIPRPPI
jgi:hypothetical protein